MNVLGVSGNGSVLGLLSTGTVTGTLASFGMVAGTTRHSTFTTQYRACYASPTNAWYI